MSVFLLCAFLPGSHHGLATGTYFTGSDLGISIGAILLGVVSQLLGFGMIRSISAACALLSLAGLLADRYRHRPTAP